MEMETSEYFAVWLDQGLKVLFYKLEEFVCSRTSSILHRFNYRGWVLYKNPMGMSFSPRKLTLRDAFIFKEFNDFSW